MVLRSSHNKQKHNEEVQEIREFLANTLGRIVLVLGPYNAKYNCETNDCVCKDNHDQAKKISLSAEELKVLVSTALLDEELPYKENEKDERYVVISAGKILTIPQVDDSRYDKTISSKYRFFTLRQKLHLLIAASRFVIIEDSTPSGAILEIGYAKNTGTVTVILRAKRKSRDGKVEKLERATWMTLDFEIHSQDFIVEHYSLECDGNGNIKNYQDLIRLIKQVTKRAEERIEKRYEKLIDVINKYS